MINEPIGLIPLAAIWLNQKVKTDNGFTRRIKAGDIVNDKLFILGCYGTIDSSELKITALNLDSWIIDEVSLK